MNPSNSTAEAPLRRPSTSALLRDPAVWAWVVVALLAILPVKAALARHERGADTALLTVRTPAASYETGAAPGPAG